MSVDQSGLVLPVFGHPERGDDLQVDDLQGLPQVAAAAAVPADPAQAVELVAPPTLHRALMHLVQFTPYNFRPRACGRCLSCDVR